MFKVLKEKTASRYHRSVEICSDCVTLVRFVCTLYGNCSYSLNTWIFLWLFFASASTYANNKCNMQIWYSVCLTIFFFLCLSVCLSLSLSLSLFLSLILEEDGEWQKYDIDMFFCFCTLMDRNDYDGLKKIQWFEIDVMSKNW